MPISIPNGVHIDTHSDSLTHIIPAVNLCYTGAMGFRLCRSRQAENMAEGKQNKAIKHMINVHIKKYISKHYYVRVEENKM